MDKEQRKVLECLLDSYERSKTFRGENQVNQRFVVSIGKLFPRYYDDAEYDYFCRINESLEELGAAGLVALEYQKKGVLKKVTLNTDRLDACYELLGRMPKRQEQEELVQIWNEVCGHALWHLEQKTNRYMMEGAEAPEVLETTGKKRQESAPDIELAPLIKYIEAQRIRVGKNLNVEYYQNDLTEYQNLLMAVKAVLENQEEIFIRNFSIQLFHDSKRMEQLKRRVEALLYQYGEYQERESVLEECGIVNTPTYVMMKGNGSIKIGRKGSVDEERDSACGTEEGGGRVVEQTIDLSLLAGDIALSTESVKGLGDVAVMGKRVVTVENLTSFHDYTARDDFVIYLGGFHNKVKGDFLRYLYQRNPDREYRHFGDIDAGGFYILEHLKKKTGIPFRSLYMDTEILQKYQEDRKPLTENDRKRLLQLKDGLEERLRRGEQAEDYREVISYMLENNCKLEQEAVILPSCY